MTKPNVANGSNNLELEATTEAIASDQFRLHDVVSRPAASRGMIMYSDLLCCGCSMSIAIDFTVSGLRLDPIRQMSCTFFATD